MNMGGVISIIAFRLPITSHTFPPTIPPNGCAMYAKLASLLIRNSFMGYFFFTKNKNILNTRKSSTQYA